MATNPLEPSFEDEQKLDYNEFAQLLTMNRNLLSIMITNRVLPATELDSIAHSLVKISHAIGSTTIMFDCLLEFEFEKAGQAQSVILRSNSLITKSVDRFIQLYSISYLKDVLLDNLTKILMDESVSLEVDATKLITVEDEQEKKKIVQQNLNHLRNYTIQFLESIFNENTIKTMPYELRSACNKIKSLAEQYNFESVPLIGSLIILRLFNPSIVFPEARKLLPAEVVVDAHKRRNLTLITKIIQNISNQVAFGSKEAYMIPLNPLLEDYKKKNEEFMLKTCLDKNIITEYQKEAYRHVQEAYANKIVTSDPSLLKEIQNIHSILQKNKDRILKALDESGVHENLSPLFESILRKLPPLTPIIIKKPLPPTPQINKDVENASTEKTDGDNERYKRLLEKAQTIDDRDLEAMNILTIRGTDKEGRPIVVFTEEHVRKEDLDRVLYYIVKKLDKVVEKNYVMIWCVNNSSSQNRPGFNWLLNVYRSLSRKYKKNLKSFYLIHPTFMFKVIIKCFRPFVSDKFWKKLHLCDRLSQLYVDIDKETLPLPPSILTYDFLLNKESSDMNPVFGVSLSELMSRPENKGETIPKFLKHLMDHIRQHGMNAQGLFRLSGNVTEVNKVKILLNNNDNVDLCHCDIHTIATILKQFFREMPEPLFTYECYDGFLNILQNINQVDNAINNHSYITPMKNMLNKLPHVNFLVCKELFSLLVQTSLNSEENKMTSHNLAIVFGPNILRSKSENAISALQDNSQVTKVVDFIIQEYTNLFMSQSISRRGRPNNIRCSTLIEQFNNHA